MIDPQDGQITLEGIRIERGLTRSVFRAKPNFRDWADDYGDTITDFSYKRRLVENGISVLLTVHFHVEALESVEFFFLLPSEKETGTWADWSEVNEQSRKSLHDTLLSADLGAAPYHFAWGNVMSVYDERSGASRIIVRYAV
jgi:hypothetical protein